jgi:dGTPase
MWLAPYASHPDRTRGRRYPEPAAPTRSDFQRDRDRIVHSTAFRRLVYKTQVAPPLGFSPHSMRVPAQLS